MLTHAGAILYPAFSGAMFRAPDPRPVLGKMKHVIILIFLGIGLDLIVLTENPIILYPLSLVSAAGVIILLAMVYSIALAMVLKLENRFNRLSQMAVLLAAACAVAILQILVTDWFRYQITGTWGSFILG